MKVLFRCAVASPDLYDFGFLLGDGPKHLAPAQPWLLPDGRAVLARRPLPHLKRTFLHLMVLHITGAELRRWM